MAYYGQEWGFPDASYYAVPRHSQPRAPSGHRRRQGESRSHRHHQPSRRHSGAVDAANDSDSTAVTETSHRGDRRRSDRPRNGALNTRLADATNYARYEERMNNARRIVETAPAARLPDVDASVPPGASSTESVNAGGTAQPGDGIVTSDEQLLLDVDRAWRQTSLAGDATTARPAPSIVTQPHTALTSSVSISASPTSPPPSAAHPPISHPLLTRVDTTTPTSWALNYAVSQDSPEAQLAAARMRLNHLNTGMYVDMTPEVTCNPAYSIPLTVQPGADMSQLEADLLFSLYVSRRP